jgi:hypothetical protein
MSNKTKVTVTIVLDRIDFDPPIDKPHTLIKALTPQTVERLGFLVGPATAQHVLALMRELKEDLGFQATCSVSLEPEENGQALPDKSRS